MFLSYFTLFVALSLSAVAAWYSIIGLTAIFASAVVPIVIMGGILEVAKVTVTVWLHEYWHRCRLLMKCYLVPAVAMLMVITSMGIFGFLSKAHTDQSLVSGDVQSKIAIYDEKIKTQKENIEANRKALKQMDEAVDSVLGRSTDEKGADKAVALRRAQQKERGRLQAEILQSQKSIAELNEARAPIAAEVRKVEAEVGPIKYIAALIYGDAPDTNLLEKAVRWVIILLVVVFDPLAIMMVLAATESFKWRREDQDKSKYPTDDGPLTDQQVEQLRATAEPELPKGETVVTSQLFNDPGEHPADTFDHEAGPDESVDPHPPGWMFQQYPYLNKFDHFKNLKPMPAPVSQVSADESDDESELPYIKEAIKQWKAANPNDTIKNQRHMLARGEISELPWMGLIDSLPNYQAVHSFGAQLPNLGNKGDTHVRTDQVPNRLFKHNGIAWIELDKNLSDSYTYNTAYIDYLIEKISLGEYDPDLLSEIEREQVANRLQERQ
jgi:hypothetical protein